MSLAENDLAMRAQAGDPRAANDLVRSLNGFAEARVHDSWFPPPGLEWDDLYQVSRMAVHEAMTCWDRRGSFVGFAGYVIERRMRDALRSANGRKHEAVSDAVPVHTLGDGNGSGYEVFASPETNVVDLLAHRDDLRDIASRLASLSDIERAAVIGQLNDKPYTQISAETGADVKSIDNAMQRARRKLREAA